MTLTVHELRQFDDIASEWDDLWRASSSGSSIFSSFAWQQIWWNVFGDGYRLRLLVVRDGHQLIGIGPLMGRDTSIGFVGGSEVCDYLDFITQQGRECEVVSACLQQLTHTSAKEIDLRFLPAESPNLNTLPLIGNQIGWQASKVVDDVCPAVELSDSWETYLSTLSKKDRHELRRKLRRLAEAGRVEFQVATGQEQIERDVEDFVLLHRLSRPEKAAFMDGQMKSFFTSIIYHFRPLGMVTTYFLALEGSRVAATLCFEHRDELWVYNSGFNRDFAHLSVGLALKAFCIQDAIRRAKRKVDFLRGAEPYKYHLGARDVPAYHLRLTRE